MYSVRAWYVVHANDSSTWEGETREPRPSLGHTASPFLKNNQKYKRRTGSYHRKAEKDKCPRESLAEHHGPLPREQKNHPGCCKSKHSQGCCMEERRHGQSLNLLEPVDQTFPRVSGQAVNPIIIFRAGSHANCFPVLGVPKCPVFGFIAGSCPFVLFSPGFSSVPHHLLFIHA